jgi:hypothetical protein
MQNTASLTSSFSFQSAFPDGCVLYTFRGIQPRGVRWHSALRKDSPLTRQSSWTVPVVPRRMLRGGDSGRTGLSFGHRARLSVFPRSGKIFPTPARQMKITRDVSPTWRNDSEYTKRTRRVRTVDGTYRPVGRAGLGYHLFERGQGPLTGTRPQSVQRSLRLALGCQATSIRVASNRRNRAGGRRPAGPGSAEAFERARAPRPHPRTLISSSRRGPLSVVPVKRDPLYPFSARLCAIVHFQGRLTVRLQPGRPGRPATS